MPLVLIVAFAASIGVHALVLWVPDIDLSTAPALPQLKAELQSFPKAAAVARPPPTRPQRKSPSSSSTPGSSSTQVASIQPTETEPVNPVVFGEETDGYLTGEAPSLPEFEAIPIEQHLPAYGMIRFRVDRGDSGFEVGYSVHDWKIVDGRYKITALTETSGLIALFKPLRIELESSGTLTVGGLQPDLFTIRRNGRETKERAEFDWARMQVRIGGGAEQPVSMGAQDLLSFHYQLGFLPRPAANNTLPIATGKKFEYYRLEVIGEELIDVPAGQFRTLHLSAPGNTTTELWLAYDALLLPVKIRHTDRKGDSFVQVATELKISKEE